MYTCMLPTIALPLPSIDVLLERPGVLEIEAAYVRRLVGRLRRGRCRRHLTRTARRVLGGAHPVTSAIEDALRMSREVLCARENGKKVTFVKH
jgi:hypothetical protein